MAKYRKDTPEAVPTDEIVVSTAVPTPVATEATAPAPSAAPLLNFDRYFSTTGRPAHHKAGMKAFLQGNYGQKRTKAAWDALFVNY